MIPCGPAPSEEKKKVISCIFFFFWSSLFGRCFIIIPDLTVRATLHFGRTQMELEIQASPRTLRSPEFRERSDLRRGRVKSKAPPGGIFCQGGMKCRPTRVLFLGLTSWQCSLTSARRHVSHFGGLGVSALQSAGAKNSHRLGGDKESMPV